MPSPRLIAVIVLLVLLAAIGGGALWQEHRVSAAQAAGTKAKAELGVVKADLASVQAALQAAQQQPAIITRYVDRVQVVREAARVITKEIPVYVTPAADAACPVTVGFVRIHDAAAAGRAPQPPAGDPDAPAAGVALSAVADTVAGNYETCNAIRDQLTSLQEWVDSEIPAPQATP